MLSVSSSPIVETKFEHFMPTSDVSESLKKSVEEHKILLLEPLPSWMLLRRSAQTARFMGQVGSTEGFQGMVNAQETMSAQEFVVKSHVRQR